MISVSHLTAIDASPEDFVRAAAKAGFDAVGLRIVPPAHTPDQWPVVGDARRVRNLRKLADELGVAIFEAEVFSARRDIDADAVRRGMEAAAELGAKVLVSAGHDDDEERLVDEYRLLCGLAAPLGLTVGIEFMPFRPLATLAQARDILRRIDCPNAGILIDTLHLARSGGTPQEVAGMAPGEIAYIHLCDAAAKAPSPEDFVNEARGRRYYPGQGALPLAELMAVIPSGIPITVEAPHPDQAGLPADERLARAYKQTTRFLSGHRGPFPARSVGTSPRAG